MNGKVKYHPLGVTDSTNSFLSSLKYVERESCPFEVAWAEFQQAGRGQKGNTWESEKGKNLLFSILFHPDFLSVESGFLISQAISLTIIETLKEVMDPHNMPMDVLTIKWPNDIYWQDRKLAGILIENTLMGSSIKDSIVGVGLNVNQTEFLSSAPNPVSIRQITHQEQDRMALMECLVERFVWRMEELERGGTEELENAYHSLLYRREGFFPYKDSEGEFQARLERVCKDGRIILTDRGGQERKYEIKEVSFLLPHQ